MKKVKLHHRINLLRQLAPPEEAPPRRARARQLSHAVTVLLLAGIAALLAAALAVQFARRAPPCPQCLLERAGLLLVGVGLLLNLRTGPRPVHYALVLLAAAFSACVALPHAGAYAASLDPWMLATALGAGVLAATMLGFELRYPTRAAAARPAGTTTRALFVLLAALAVANLASVTVECGLSRCPTGAVARYRPPGA